MILASSAVPSTFTLSLGPLLLLAAGVLAVLDSALRFRRPGGNALLAILALVAGLLLVVKAFTPAQQFVSTSIPALYLAVAITIVLLVELLVKSARKSGLLWLTIVSTLVAAAAAIVTYLKIG